MLHATVPHVTGGGTLIVQKNTTSITRTPHPNDTPKASCGRVHVDHLHGTRQRTHGVPRRQHFWFLVQNIQQRFVQIFFLDCDLKHVFIEPFVTHGQISFVSFFRAPRIFNPPFDDFLFLNVVVVVIPFFFAPFGLAVHRRVPFFGRAINVCLQKNQNKTQTRTNTENKIKTSKCPLPHQHTHPHTAATVRATYWSIVPGRTP